MAYGEWINMIGLNDTGGYDHLDISNWVDSGGDKRGLRFLMGPLHSNSAVLQGGTGTVTRTTWGVAGASDNYCEYLQGTAKSAGGTVLTPNEPNGYGSWGSNTNASNGAKQHMICVLYPEDTPAGMLGRSNISSFANSSTIRLRGTYRFREARNGSTFFQFINSCGDPANNYVNGTTAYNWNSNKEHNLDYIIPFVPLFSTSDPTASTLNSSDLTIDFQDSLTGETLDFFTAGDMFDTAKAIIFADNLWSQINATDPRFNNFSAADKRKCVFISKEPIQGGQHHIPNHYLASHITQLNTKGNTMTDTEMGFDNSSYNTVHEQIYSQYFQGAGYDILNDVGQNSDTTGNSGWDIIIRNKISGAVQHIGDTHWHPTGGTATWYFNTFNQGTSAIMMDHISPIGNMGTNKISGGLLEGATSSDRLLQGATPLLDNGYVGAAVTFQPEYGLISLAKAGDQNNSGFNSTSAYSAFNLSGGPGSNFANGQGYGTKSPNWTGSGATANARFGIEDQEIVPGSTATTCTHHPVFAGVFDGDPISGNVAFNSSVSEEIESTSLGSYNGTNPFYTPMIVRFDRIDYTPWNSYSTGPQRNFNGSTLYYNSFASCPDGPINLSVAVTNYGGCNTSCAGSVQINTDLTTVNMENADILWLFTGQTVTPIFSAGPYSNHTGTGLWTDAGGTSIPITGSCGKASLVCPGNHMLMVIDRSTGCSYSEMFTVTNQGVAPTINLVQIISPTCNTNGQIQFTCDDPNNPTGTAPYSWTITSGGVAIVSGTAGSASAVQTASPLFAGQYIINVSDATGCTDNAGTYTLSVAGATHSLLFAPTITDETCAGSDGSFSMSWDVTPNVTYLFSVTGPSLSFTNTPLTSTTTTINVSNNGLGAGTYTYTLVDPDSCDVSGSFTIGIVPTVGLSYIATSAVCGGGTGTIQLVPNAGSGTYTYAYKLNGTSTWILSSTATITGLGAGSWDIQVTDSNGCTAEELGVVLTEGNSPTAILNNYVAPCTPGPTQFTIIAEDSSGNLINANDYTITNLIDFNSGASVGTWVILGSPANGEYEVSGVTSATQYTITITVTATGCTHDMTFVLGGGNSIVVNYTYSDVSCASTNDGTIEVTPTGGTPGYTFVWTKDGAAYTPDTPTGDSNLIGGTYTVTVTDQNGCSETITQIILANAIEDTAIPKTTGPTCVTGDDGTFEVSNTVGDFPFELWFSTDNATFVQIQNSGGTVSFNSTDLVGLLVDNTWTETVSGNNLSLTGGLDIYIYLVSVVNSCQGPTVADQIPLSPYVPMTLSAVVVDSNCCDECSGEIDLTVHDGVGPFTYSWITTSGAHTSTTNTATWPGATIEDIRALCPGDYEVTVTDFCGETVTGTWTIANNPVLIEDIQYTHPYCNDCGCGSITITASGGVGDLYYSIDDGLHWVNTDPNATDSGPTIFNITNYNASTTTPGTWTSIVDANTNITYYGFDNLDSGIYRIWVHDASPCFNPMFDDMIEDCNPGGPATCVNFCVDCTEDNCYADFVDIFADHSVAIWNGGTKVELESISNLNVTTTGHTGVSIMGGTNGTFTFEVQEDFWWPGMNWAIEVFIEDPGASSLSYDSNLFSPYYGDVCCDVPGTGSCNLDCCADHQVKFDFTAGGGQGGHECGTPSCSANNSGWCFQLTETSAGTEICPEIDGGLNSQGYFYYTPTQAQMGAPVEFTLTNLSVTAPLGAAALEAMYVVRVTNNVIDAPASSYGGTSGSPLIAPIENCDNCAAAVLDNGMLNLIDIFGAENCDCGCPPGYELDENQYTEDLNTGTCSVAGNNNYIDCTNAAGVWTGNLIVNPNFNTCIGFENEAAPLYGKCFDANAGTVIGGVNNPVDCLNISGVWKNNWTAVTVAQNMPCCANTLTWGQVGAKIFGVWTGGTYTSPVPVGQDVNLLPFTSQLPTLPGEAEVIDVGAGILATDPSWTMNFPVYNNRLKDIGIWPQWFNQYTSTTTAHQPVNSRPGITICTIDIPVATNFILALAGDDEVRFSVDGQVYIHLLNQTSNNTFWNLFPIALLPGKHTLQFDGKNVTGPAAFAFELYNQNVGGIPTVAYLADPTLTATDLQNITVLDGGGTPISSESYINGEFHSTTAQFVGHECTGTQHLTYCNGVFRCAGTASAEPDCPECLDDLEDIVGCVGNLATTVYDKMLGGVLDMNSFTYNTIDVWRVLLIRYLIKRFGLGFRGSCLSPKILLTWTTYLTKICPDCASKAKTDEDVDYLPDPNESSSPIRGVDGVDDIQNFDF